MACGNADRSAYNVCQQAVLLPHSIGTYAGDSAIATGVVKDTLRPRIVHAEPGAIGPKALLDLSNELLHPLHLIHGSRTDTHVRVCRRTRRMMRLTRNPHGHDHQYGKPCFQKSILALPETDNNVRPAPYIASIFSRGGSERVGPGSGTAESRRYGCAANMLSVSRRDRLLKWKWRPSYF